VRLHHVGFVVASISQTVERFVSAIAGHWDGKIFHDPVQTVRVTFLQHGAPGQASLELVEPAAPDSRVAAFLKRGGGLHHLCYEVPSLEEQLANSRSLGAVIVQKPVPAVAFDGRSIAWVYTREKLLIEYLETRS
jgi:methylmalonyl-CoA/ethylmalonyl-CoA epimerase